MNLTKEFLEILADPVSGSSLQVRNDNTELCPEEGSACYNIEQGIPVLLSKNNNPETDFNYREHYEKDALAFDYSNEYVNPLEIAEVNRLRETILSRIAGEGEWILDVGCGDAWLAGRLTPARKVISMDISFENPKKALENIASKNHFVVVGDAYQIPFRNNSIDCIVASEIIEHTVNPGEFIDNLIRVLKPGGKLIVTTPNAEKIQYSLCVHCNQATPHHAHLHSFTKTSLQSILKDKNLSQLKIITFNSKLLAKTRLLRLFKFLPQPIWEIIDRAAIGLSNNKAHRILIEALK